MPESTKPPVYERFVRELAVLECSSGHAVRKGSRGTAHGQRVQDQQR
jgi:hypothetical protein